MAVSKVSVITVCLNVRDTIRLTLESVKNQNFPNIEHVIIDGVSTDGTLNIIAEYKVGFLSSEKDSGVYDAMDKGSRAFTGDIAIFLNAGDTFFDDDVCAKVARYFDETRADIVFGDLLPVYLHPQDTHDHTAFQSGQPLSLAYVRNRRYLYNESIHHQATFYRRWVLRRCPFLCERPEATGEYNVLLRAVMKEKAKVKYIALPISRFALGGISTKNYEVEWARYVAARDILRSLYYPKFEEISPAQETEFYHHGAPATLSRTERRALLKSRLQATFLFKFYDRLARGLAMRVVNALRLELAEAVQARLVEHDAALARQSLALDEFRGTMGASLGQLQTIHAEVGAFAKPLSDAFIVINDINARADAMQRDLRAVQSKLQANARQVGSLADLVHTTLAGLKNDLSALAASTAASSEQMDTVTRQIADNAVGARQSLAEIQTQLRSNAETLAALTADGDALKRDISAELGAAALNASTQLEPLSQQIAASLTSLEQIKALQLSTHLAQPRLERKIDTTLQNVGRIGLSIAPGEGMPANGTKIYSQWDEDGIIDYIVRHCDIGSKLFVEFGVGDYSEANTRFLLAERGWSGLVIDSSAENISALQSSDIYWKYPIQSLTAVINSENINDLIFGAGISGDIGILSIDIDGVDYWIWEAISVISPRVVICEYNGIFGSNESVTVPYDPTFDRRTKHYSFLYAGASLSALEALGASKGYGLVGCNSAGNNAFFVRGDILKTSSIVSGPRYRKPMFREARNSDGTLSYLDVSDALKLIKDLEVYDVSKKSMVRIEDLNVEFD